MIMWGFLLRGVQKDDIERGMVLAKPGSITPHTKFEAEVYVLKKEEGRAAYTLFSRLQTSVLCKNYGCNGFH